MSNYCHNSWALTPYPGICTATVRTGSRPTRTSMEEGNPLTALAATGSVASRFVTQSEIDSAKERRDAEWKAAYAR